VVRVYILWLWFADVVGASVSCGRIAGIRRSVCLGGVLFSCAIRAQGMSTK
jgi:hypothetical protein